MTDEDRTRIIAALYRPGKRDWPWRTSNEIADRVGMSANVVGTLLAILRAQGFVVMDTVQGDRKVNIWRASEGLKRAFPDGPPRITRRPTANFDQPVKARGEAK